MRSRLRRWRRLYLARLALFGTLTKVDTDLPENPNARHQSPLSAPAVLLTTAYRSCASSTLSSQASSRFCGAPSIGFRTRAGRGPNRFSRSRARIAVRVRASPCAMPGSIPRASPSLSHCSAMVPIIASHLTGFAFRAVLARSSNSMLYTLTAYSITVASSILPSGDRHPHQEFRCRPAPAGMDHGQESGNWSPVPRHLLFGCSAEIDCREPKPRRSSRSGPSQMSTGPRRFGANCHPMDTEAESCMITAIQHARGRWH